MTNEIERALALDWWAEQRAQVEEDLRKRLPDLLLQAREAVAAMPMTAFVRRSKFHTDVILPLATKWIEAEHARLSSEIGESLPDLFGENTDDHNWSTTDYAEVGMAAAFTAAPLAALPFVGLVFGGGFLGIGASIAVVPALAVGGGLVALGYGGQVRGWTIERLRERYRVKVEADLTLLVLGDAARPQEPSLKGTIFAELDGILSSKLEEAPQ